MTDQTMPTRGLVSRRGVAEFAAAVLLAVGNLFAAMRISSSQSSLDAGLVNADMPFLASRSDLIWAGVWFATFGILFVCAIVGMVERRTALISLTTAMICVCIPTSFLTCKVRSLPHERYLVGLQEWAYSGVDSNSIRQWNLTLTPADKLTELPASAWPAAVRTLSPTVVYQAPAGGGIMMQFGQSGTWSCARRVFVGADDKEMPPHDDPRYQWTENSPGIWISLIVSD